MTRSLLEDFDATHKTKTASAKADGKGKQKDPMAVVKLSVAVLLIVAAIGWFSYQRGWFGGKNAVPTEPNLPPEEVPPAPTTPPPQIGDETTGSASPEAPPVRVKVQGAN